MASSSWLEAKEQVRQAVDIVDLVGSYAPLRRQGREYVAICPWHDDSRPSLHVNPQRQSYKCFVCDVGGDIFSFVMRMEGIEFREALQMLAERAGISLAVQDDRRPKAKPGSPDDKRTLLQCMAWAEQQYQRCLLESPEAEPGRRYLTERGISLASMQQFHLGFAPDRWDFLLARAAGTPFSPQVLERVGLVIPRSSGEGFYDRFRGRVLFSIRDAQGAEPRPIALGGRILPQHATEDTAKYINSPETPLFSKNRQVYGLDQARPAITSERNVVVVEGYTDCVMCHQYGVANVVAVLGTALGENHISLLRRYADTITLVLDGDEAGQRRTNQILELFVAAQVDLRILTLPQDLDPCDFLVSHGSDTFRQLLSGAVDALEHKIRTVTKGLDPTTATHQANAALEDVLGTLSRAPRLAASTATATRVREEQVLSRLANTFRVPEEQLRKRMTDLRRGGGRRPISPAAEVPLPAAGIEIPRSLGEIHPWDLEVLQHLLVGENSLPSIAAEIRIEQLQTPVARLIYGKCLELAEAGEPANFGRLMLESEDPAMKSLLVKIDESGRAKSGSDLESALRDTLKNFRLRKEDAHFRNFVAGSDSQVSQDSQEQELAELIASLKVRQGKSEPTEG